MLVSLCLFRSVVEVDSLADHEVSIGIRGLALEALQYADVRLGQGERASGRVLVCRREAVGK